MIDFNIGDKIVYPNQGVGVIDFIEEKVCNDIKVITWLKFVELCNIL